MNQPKSRSFAVVTVAFVVVVLAATVATPADAHVRHFRRGPHFGFHVGPFYHSGFYGFGFEYPYGYRHYPYAVVDGRHLAVDRDRGAVDLNVRPKKAEVWIDGAFAGTTGTFDGYPSYLWLKEGSYRIEIRSPGYKTWSDEVRVTPRAVIKLKFKLVPGDSAPAGS